MRLALIAFVACAVCSCIRFGSPEPQAAQCPLACEEYSCKYDDHGTARECECME